MIFPYVRDGSRGLWLIFLQGNEVYFDVRKVNADALR
jgi:hypothetical protein